MTTQGALFLGLATSLHCVGMCGPFACGLSSLAKSESQRLWGTSLYHLCRILSYSLIGATCGLIGQQPLRWFFDSPACLLPWAMVLVLLSIAFGYQPKLPRPAWLARFTSRSRFFSMRHSAPIAAASMGFFSPLLPCGPLYAAFGTALLTGSALNGAEYMAAFALGTVPLLWITQSQFHQIKAALSPRAMDRIRRGLALVTALMLIWRLHGTIPPSFYGGKPLPKNENELPSCCH